jgi:hypothetical protein
MALTTLAALRSARRRTRNYSGKTGPGAGGTTYGSHWLTSGTDHPSAGVSPADTATGVIPTRATTGAWQFDAPQGSEKVYIGSAGLSFPQTGSLITWLVDRLWHAGPFTPTSGDYALAGLAIDRSVDGEQVQIFVEGVTAFSAAAHTLTFTYVNSDGVGGRTATATLPASYAAGRAFPVCLQAGDRGVRQITAMSGSAAPPTGAFNVFLAKRLGPVVLSGSQVNEPCVPLRWDESLIGEIEPNACLAMLDFTSTASTHPAPVGCGEFLYG